MQLGWVLFMFVLLHKMRYWRLYYQDKNYITVNLFCKDDSKVVMMKVNKIKNNFSV